MKINSFIRRSFSYVIVAAFALPTLSPMLPKGVAEFAGLSTSLSACLKQSRIDRLEDKLDKSWIAIYEEVDAIFKAQGEADDPNPETNEELAALIAESSEIIAKNLGNYIRVLGVYGVSETLLEEIKGLHEEFLNLSIDYSTAMNINNTGGSGGDEGAIYGDMIASALELAGKCKEINTTYLFNSYFDSTLYGLAVVLSQLAQSYRLMTTDPADSYDQIEIIVTNIALLLNQSAAPEPCVE